MTNRTYVKPDGSGAVVMVSQMIDGVPTYPPPPPGMVQVAGEPTGANVVWDFDAGQFVAGSVAREDFPALTARQFQIGLVRNGISIAAVEALLGAEADPVLRQEGFIEWNHAASFERLHPLVVGLSAQLGFTPEQVDAMWTAALAV